MITANSTLHHKTRTQQLRLLHKSVASTLLVVIFFTAIYALILWEAVDLEFFGVSATRCSAGFILLELEITHGRKCQCI